MLKRASKFSRSVLNLLKEVFPHFTIVEEYYVNYLGKRLFFDFLIKELNLLIEVQGNQHLSFNKFMHDSREDFLRQRLLDKLKEEWAHMNGFILVCFYPSDVIDKSTLLEKIENVREKLGSF